MTTRAQRLALLLALLAAPACSDATRAPSPERPSEDAPAEPTAQDLVERGRYLVTAAACGDCHTPLAMGPNGPAPDRSRLLSGHPEGLALPPAPVLPEGPWNVTVAASMTAWSGPWGTSFTANLTPDPETGLGRWTPESFIATIRNGRHMGIGRPLLPPMPVAMIKNYSDDDLRAMFAYLQSIPPVRNRVPNPIPRPTAAVRPPEGTDEHRGG